MDIAIPYIEPDARFALWSLVTIVTAFCVSVWTFVGCTVASEYGPWDLVGRVEAFVIVVVIAAWIGGPALAGALMIHNASVTGSSSVPGGVGVWIARSAAATVVWFLLVLVTASVFERANVIVIMATWLLSVVAALGVVVLLGLGS